MNYDDIITTVANKYGVDPARLMAIAQQESSGDPNAYNASTGASGLFQFIPATAKAYGIDPRDPAQAADAAAKMFAENMARFGGNADAATAAHFAGPNTKLWGPKTEQYVKGINARMDQPVDESRLASADAPVDESRLAQDNTDMYTRTAQAQRNEPGIPNFDAAVGGALTGIGLGARELGSIAFPGLVKPGEFDEWKQAMRGLWSTPGGKAGTIVGGAVPAAATMAIPGVNTVVGAGAVGAGMGLLQPTGEAGIGMRRGLNTAVGAGMSAGMQGGMNTLGRWLANRGAAQAAEQAATAPQDAVRNATTSEVQAAGYKIPPTQVNPRDPGIVNRVVEGIGGKLQTAQLASLENQPLTTEIAKRELGIAPETPLTQAAIDAVRKPAYAAYKAVSNVGTVPVDEQFATDFGQVLGPYLQLKGEFPNSASIPKVDALITDLSGKPQIESGSIVAMVQRLRKDGFARINSPLNNPEEKTLGQIELGAQSALEDLLDRHLANTGQSDLLDAYRSARVLLAKSHTVENALDPATGQVVAKSIGNEFGKGRPLTGGLATIGKMATTFPKAVDNVTSSMPGFSPFDMWASAGALMTGNPKTALALLSRPAVRAAALSAPYQRWLASPRVPADPTSGLLGGVLPDALQSEWGRLLGSSVVPALARSP